MTKFIGVNSFAYIWTTYTRDVSPKVKILIVSFDQFQASVKQNIFYSDQNVLNISLHKEGGPNYGIEEVIKPVLM